MHHKEIHISGKKSRSKEQTGLDRIRQDQTGSDRIRQNETGSDKTIILLTLKSWYLAEFEIEKKITIFENN